MAFGDVKQAAVWSAYLPPLPTNRPLPHHYPNTDSCLSLPTLEQQSCLDCLHAPFPTLPAPQKTEARGLATFFFTGREGRGCVLHDETQMSMQG